MSLEETGRNRFRDILFSDFTKLLLIFIVTYVVLFAIPSIFGFVSIWNDVAIRNFLTIPTFGTLEEYFAYIFLIFTLIFALMVLNVVILTVVFLATIYLGNYLARRFGIEIHRSQKQKISRWIMQLVGFVIGFVVYGWNFVGLFSFNAFAPLLGVFLSISDFILNTFYVILNVLYVPLLISYSFVLFNDVGWFIWRKYAKKKLVLKQSGVYYAIPDEQARFKRHSFGFSKMTKVFILIGIIISTMFITKVFFRYSVTVRVKFANSFVVNNLNSTTPYCDPIIANVTMGIASLSQDVVNEILGLPPSSPFRLYFQQFPATFYWQFFNAPDVLLQGIEFSTNIPKGQYVFFLIIFEIAFNSTEPAQTHGMVVSWSTNTTNNYNSFLVPLSDPVVASQSSTVFLTKYMVINSVSIAFDSSFYPLVSLESANTTTFDTFNFVDMLIQP